MAGSFSAFPRIAPPIAAACAAAFLLFGCSEDAGTGAGAAAALATDAPPSILAGTVRSEREGPMEGVVVRAKKGIVTVSVVSGADGVFRFPPEKLEAGEYALSVRAVGYDLEGQPTVNVSLGAPSEIDLDLVPTANLAAQLTNMEWIASLPGTPQQRRLISGCTNCHSVERIMTSTYTAEEWEEVILRMATYSNNSFHLKPQLRAVARDTARFLPDGFDGLDYFASINMSDGPLDYELVTLPRVSGEGTKVVFTEYDLPRKDSQPHDVYVDEDGIVWYSDFGDQFLGRLDPATLEVKEYPVPLHREGFPKGALDLEVDPDGNLWLALMFQAGVARFDPETETMETFQLPPEILTETSQQGMVAPHALHVDNKVWMAATDLRGLHRLDLATGEYETIDPFADFSGPHSIYTMMADAENDLWFLDYASENIGVVDAETLEVTLYPTPTERSRPRRGRFDDRGRIWFAEFNGERVGMFDPATGEMKEWEVPGGYFAPYDAAYDKEGKVWTAGMNADRVLRLDPETGAFVQYQLPHYTNVRRIFVDNSGPRPTLWIGNNHGASIIKLELLD